MIACPRCAMTVGAGVATPVADAVLLAAHDGACHRSYVLHDELEQARRRLLQLDAAHREAQRLLMRAVVLESIPDALTLTLALAWVHSLLNDHDLQPLVESLVRRAKGARQEVLRQEIQKSEVGP